MTQSEQNPSKFSRIWEDSHNRMECPGYLASGCNGRIVIGNEKPHVGMVVVCSACHKTWKARIVEWGDGRTLIWLKGIGMDGLLIVWDESP